MKMLVERHRLSSFVRRHKLRQQFKSSTGNKFRVPSSVDLLGCYNGQLSVIDGQLLKVQVSLPTRHGGQNTYAAVGCGNFQVTFRC